MSCHECEEESRKNRAALARRSLGAPNPAISPVEDIVQQLGAIQFLLDQAETGQTLTSEMISNAQAALTSISQDAINLRGTALSPEPATPGFSTGATALIGVTGAVVGLGIGMLLTSEEGRGRAFAEESPRPKRRRRRR